MTDLTRFAAECLAAIDADGLLKTERPMVSPQRGRIAVAPDGASGREVINLCANNYLGLADHPGLIAAAKTAMDRRGFGMASVRFICGTQDLHRALEDRLARFLGKEDAILFASCFDANGGLFEPLLGDDDAIVSDSLNHASLIDGIRLCKARRYRFRNADMDDLDAQLGQARADGARFVLIVTDGVFSMDGYLANLPEIARLAERHGAGIAVDDCHATGVLGPGGRGTHAHFGLIDRVDILTGTLGKALGGAIGGYVAGPRPIIELLRQRARPYLFSNALPPSVVAAGLAAIELVEAGDDLRARLMDNARFWRAGLQRLGFELLDGAHPIVPVMLHDAKASQAMAGALFDLGVYVTSFSYPVVPHGAARIRTQMSAALTRADLDQALDAFAQAGRATGVLS